MPINEDLLSLLACPACEAPVRAEGDELACEACGRRYPVREGVPVMLAEAAEPPERKPAAETKDPS